MIWCIYMKRYQVYLNPGSVSVLDEFEKYTSIPRSRLIRESIDRLAQNLSKIFIEKDITPNEKLFLDSLVGVININTPKQTNYASEKDKKYLID